MESLGIDLRLIIIQIINFGLLLFLLNKFLYKPILKILDERKKKVAESLAQAQKIEEEHVRLEEEKKKELQAAQEAGREFFEKAKTEGERQRNEIIGRGKEEAERILQRTKEQLELEKEKLKEDLRAEIADLSIATAEKLLEKRIGKAEEKELLSQALKKLKEKPLESVGLLEAEAFRKRRISPQAVKIATELLTLLKRTQNLKLLPEILAKLEESAFVPAEVTTSSVLAREEERKISDILEEIFGKGLKIKFKINPKILGGMVVKVGDRIFDSSLLGKAHQLRESL